MSDELSNLLYEVYISDIKATWSIGVLLKNNDGWSISVGNKQYTMVHMSDVEKQGTLSEQIKTHIERSIKDGIAQVFLTASIKSKSINKDYFDDITSRLHKNVSALGEFPLHFKTKIKI